MSRYRVSADLTSVSVEVDAANKARRLALEAPIQGLCHTCATADPEAWSTGGELDGMPVNLRVEEA